MKPLTKAPTKLKSKLTDTTLVGNCGIPFNPKIEPNTTPTTAVMIKP